MVNDCVKSITSKRRQSPFEKFICSSSLQRRDFHSLVIFPYHCNASVIASTILGPRRNLQTCVICVSMFSVLIHCFVACIPPLCLWSNKYVYAFMTGRSSDSEHGWAIGYSFICMGFLWFGSLRCTCICMYVLVLYYKQKNKFAIATCIVP